MAFRTQKISQMTPKGANLEATDLIEVSTIESGSYVTRSITGQEIIDAAVGNVDWGDIGGTLSAQTDLQSALDAKVPTTRTLTINGVTQDLSADRTFTISTGITIGTTAIASGTNGRFLFDDAGVVSETNGAFWDKASTRLQVGTTATSPAGSPLIFMGRDQNTETNFQISNATNGTGAAVGFRILSSNNRASYLYEFAQSFSSITEFASHLVLEPNAPGLKHGFIISLPETTAGSDFMIYTAGRNASNRRLTLFNGTGNLAIGTTTDAGFRLDVNGTARVVATHQIYRNNQVGAIDLNLYNGQSGWQGGMYYNTGAGGSGQRLTLYAGGASGSADGLTIFSNRNVLIQNGGTPIDAGFRLDVNGTARVQGNTNISGFLSATNYLECRSSIFLRNSSGGGNTSFTTDTTNCYLVNSATVDLQIGYGSNYTFRLNNASRSIGIQDNQGGAATTNASALLTLTSTTKGFLPPRLTTTEKNAIASPAAGLMVYDTTLNVISYYNGTMWI